MKDRVSSHKQQTDGIKHNPKDLKHGYKTLMKELSASLNSRDKPYSRLFNIKPIELVSHVLIAALQPLSMLLALVFWLVIDLLCLLVQSTTQNLIGTLPVFYSLIAGYLVGLAIELTYHWRK